MRTTLELPDDLVEKAFRCSCAETKTELVREGLKKLIVDCRTLELRELRGAVDLELDIDTSRESQEPGSG
ncbi:MAG: type II toxin-antitoxin system VapB family antitoxin [bacterium]